MSIFERDGQFLTECVISLDRKDKEHPKLFQIETHRFSVYRVH